MGSRVPATFGGDSRPQRLPTKVATTPPVIRRQFSVDIFCPIFQLRFIYSPIALNVHKYRLLARQYTKQPDAVHRHCVPDPALLHRPQSME